jgi:hypothetical protein
VGDERADLTWGQREFAREQRAWRRRTAGGGLQYLYRDEDAITYRWLVDRMGRVCEFDVVGTGCG